MTTNMTYKQDAIQYLEEAKESLALAGESDKSGIVSNLKRDIEVEQEMTE